MLVTRNLEKALGVPPGSPNLVVYRGGGALGFEGKAVAVLDAAAGYVSVL